MGGGSGGDGTGVAGPRAERGCAVGGSLGKVIGGGVCAGGGGDGAVGGAGEGRGEGDVGGRVGGEDGRLGVDLGVGGDGGGVGVEDVGDEVQDAVGDEDVGLDELGRVDVDVVAVLADEDGLARGVGLVHGERLEVGAVLEVGRDEDLVGDDVVAHDAGEGLGRHVLDAAADGLEGLVVGREDGDVFALGHVGHQVRLVEPAEEGRDLEGVRRLAQRRRRHEEVVDDLDEAAPEADVALDLRAPRAHARREDDDVLGLLGHEHILPGRHVGVLCRREERRLDVRGTRLDGPRRHRPLEDVVLQEGNRRGLVVGVPDVVERRVRDVFKGRVGGGNDLKKTIKV